MRIWYWRRLVGESGGDKLYSALSNDILTGGQGKDIFVFDTKPNKRANMDRIVDFNVRGDTIHLAKVGLLQDCQEGRFGDKAHAASDRVTYNKKTGALFYHQDGNGAKAAVQFATVSKNLKANALDFFIM